MMIRGRFYACAHPAGVTPKPRLYSEYLKAGAGDRNSGKLARRGPVSRRTTKFALLGYALVGLVGVIMRY